MIITIPTTKPISIPIGTVIIVTKDHAEFPSNCAMIKGPKKPTKAPIKIEINILKTDIRKTIYYTFHSFVASYNILSKVQLEYFVMAGNQ